MSNRNQRRATPTNCARWRKIRKHKLQQQPLCEDCENRGIVTAAEHVDHIDNDSGNNAAENLASLCAPCHSHKTAREQRGLPPTSVDVSGAPSEWQ